MLQILKETANKTYTENGAVTHRSTMSECLDLFATAGALRRAEEQEIIARFLRAYAEDADLAMKLLFFTRDIRGGIGERRVFRTVLRHLALHHSSSVTKNLPYISEFGRWDDLLVLLRTPCEAAALQCIRRQLSEDRAALERGESVSLLGKWLPSVNASNAQTVRDGKRIARALGMTDAQYRKTLVALRARIRILENDLREKDYSFDYEKQPSRAMLKYRKAFLRNDGERYRSFLDRVETGEAQLHTDTLTPYDIVRPFISDNHFCRGNEGFMRPISPEEAQALNATWASLPDFTGEENALAVIDTSASMYWNGATPAAVALSLGLYFAQHNRGAFANHFIEFSHTPQLIEIKGDTFADRLRYVASFNEVADTNLEAVFDLILHAAVTHKVPQEQLPAKLYIISDMEFNSCVRGAGATNFANAKARFAAAGYQLPEVVFWNVDSRSRQQPVTMNEQGVALVSGCSPRIFQMLQDGILSPYAFMMEVLGGERYAHIAA